MFKYNPAMGHSRCVDCGAGFGQAVNGQNTTYNDLNDYISKRIRQLFSNRDNDKTGKCMARRDELKKLRRKMQSLGLIK